MDSYDWQNEWTNPWINDNKKDEVKCECGVHITYGKDCPVEYHSEWCPLHVNKNKPENKKDDSYDDYY